MIRVRWTPQAVDDLQAIHDFVARDSSRYAEAEVSRILEAVDRIELFPRSGRVVPEYDREDVREIIERPYRVVYRVQPEIVYILMVFRSSRLAPDPP